MPVSMELGLPLRQSMGALFILRHLQGVGKPSFTARIERPPLYRGGSASKKDGCLPPTQPCKGVRSF